MNDPQAVCASVTGTNRALSRWTTLFEQSSGQRVHEAQLTNKGVMSGQIPHHKAHNHQQSEPSAKDWSLRLGARSGVPLQQARGKHKQTQGASTSCPAP